MKRQPAEIIADSLEDICCDIIRIKDNILLASITLNDIEFPSDGVRDKVRLVTSLLDTVFQSIGILDTKAIESVSAALALLKNTKQQ